MRKHHLSYRQVGRLNRGDAVYCVVYTMCPNEAVAHDIADTLLRKKLVACANLVTGVKSRYWWKGRIEERDEVLVILKTRSHLFDDVKHGITQVHPYDVPELICTRIDDGSAAYLGWIADVTR